MPLPEFPDPREADADEGIVALGGDLEPETLLAAYRRGIFPWPIPEIAVLPWFSPPLRGILEFDRLHVPRSLAKFMRKDPYELTIDAAFDRVIKGCAHARAREPTWITPGMLAAYKRLHRLGHAHSVEAWLRGKPRTEAPRAARRLVGGLYGVEVDGVFSGESMFSLRPNASKAALLHLVEHLRARGARWIDIQMVTPHLEAMGAREVPREEFLDLLEETQRAGAKLF